MGRVFLPHRYAPHSQLPGIFYCVKRVLKKNYVFYTTAIEKSDVLKACPLSLVVSKLGTGEYPVKKPLKGKSLDDYIEKLALVGRINACRYVSFLQSLKKGKTAVLQTLGFPVLFKDLTGEHFLSFFRSFVN